MLNDPTYHLHWALLLWTFWPPGHADIRPLPLHSKTFVAKFKEAFPSVVVRASQNYITGFLHIETIRKILLCLSVSVAFWLCKRNVPASYPLCTRFAVSLMDRMKYMQETVAFCVGNCFLVFFFFLHINLYWSFVIFKFYLFVGIPSLSSFHPPSFPLLPGTLSTCQLLDTVEDVNVIKLNKIQDLP